jgi:hypothetical protein
MQTFNSFQELLVANTSQQYATNNAEFAGLADLAPNEHTEVESLMDAVRQAEQDFRIADDERREHELQGKEAVDAARRKLELITATRMQAANYFERTKASLEAPLKEYGVTVVWDEPAS